MRIGLAGVGRIGAFHAQTLRGLDVVAEHVGGQVAPDPASLLSSGVDGFVIAAAPGPRGPATPGHRGGDPHPLREAGRREVGRDDQAVRSGELWFIHTIRAYTHDQSPPHASYIASSGGIFRDCSVHAFDIIRQGERPAPCTVEDALQAFRTEACERSRRDGRLVRLEEVRTH